MEVIPFHSSFASSGGRHVLGKMAFLDSQLNVNAHYSLPTLFGAHLLSQGYCGLALFLRDLRSHHRARTFDKLRCLRVTRAFTSQEGSHAQRPCTGVVANVFGKLAKLKCLDVVAGGSESIRFDRDGRQWPVRWRCEESDMWRHDWEKDALLDRLSSR